MAHNKKTSSDDVNFNRTLLAFNESIRSASPWLAKSLKMENGTTSAEDRYEGELDLEGDDDEVGLGSITLNVQVQDRQSLSANERLRKQLLGRSATNNNMKAGARVQKSEMLSASKPRPQAKPLNTKSNDDDDTEGRTAVTTKNVLSPSPQQSENVRRSSKAGSRKRTGTYLDEILAQRQSKKKKGQMNADHDKTDNM